MSSPFLGEIRIFACNFVPNGWAACNGQLLPIARYTALFSLLGTTYGGDGKTTFGLPDFQGLVAMNQGQSTTGSYYDLGQTGGEPAITLNTLEMAAHTHSLNGNLNPANLAAPGQQRSWARSSPGTAYKATQTADAPMSPLAVGTAGSSQPHNNLAPYLTLNYCIAMQGVFPPRQ